MNWKPNSVRWGEDEIVHLCLKNIDTFIAFTEYPLKLEKVVDDGQGYLVNYSKEDQGYYEHRELYSEPRYRWEENGIILSVWVHQDNLEEAQQGLKDLCKKLIDTRIELLQNLKQNIL